jgi:hypothetical protein
MVLWDFCKAFGYAHHPGEHTDWTTFRHRFHDFVKKRGGNPAYWTRERVQALLSEKCPIARGPNGRLCIGNFTDKPRPRRRPRLWVRVGKYVHLRVGDTPRVDPEVVAKLIAENCGPGPGILFSEFFDRLALEGWSKIGLSKSLPLEHRTTRDTANRVYVPGLAWLPR